MSGLDFLFEGKPPASVTSYGTSTTEMPRWLSDYTQGLITKANAVAAEPYQSYEGPRLAGRNADQQRAVDITRGSSGLYTPWITGAQQNVQGALGMAMPYIQGAGQTYTGENVNKYMNPYIENVIDRAGTLAQRQMTEKLMPSVQAAFGAAGSGPRSNVMRRTVDQGVRDLTEGINQQGLAALAAGYESGANIFGADASRQGALAGTVGNLAINSGQVGGALAEQAQQLALRDAAAQEAVGATQQADQQKSLDLAYQDFQNQRDYPKTQVDWLSSIIRGLPSNQITTESKNAPSSVYQPSMISQLGSLATGVAGIYDIFKGGDGKARGGRVAYRRGGRAMEGALCYA